MPQPAVVSVAPADPAVVRGVVLNVAASELPLPDRENPFDQRRVKLVFAAVEVDIGPRHRGAQQGRTMHRRGFEQFIHESVFRTADRMLVQRRLPQETARIIPAAMRRCENHGGGTPLWVDYLKRQPVHLTSCSIV